MRRSAAPSQSKRTKLKELQLASDDSFTSQLHNFSLIKQETKSNLNISELSRRFEVVYAKASSKKVDFNNFKYFYF